MDPGRQSCSPAAPGGGGPADALATLAIGALLAVVAVVSGIEMYSLLVGEAASPQQQAAIRRALASTPGIAQLPRLHTMHLSPDELLVAAKVGLASARSCPTETVLGRCSSHAWPAAARWSLTQAPSSPR
jgi:hypothetical protein